MFDGVCSFGQTMNVAAKSATGFRSLYRTTRSTCHENKPVLARFFMAVMAGRYAETLRSAPWLFWSLLTHNVPATRLEAVVRELTNRNSTMTKIPSKSEHMAFAGYLGSFAGKLVLRLMKDHEAGKFYTAFPDKISPLLIGNKSNTGVIPMIAATHTAQVLIPITTKEMAGETIQTVDARKPHEFLEVGKDFSNWIKDRISKYNFVENQDFTVFAEIGENSQGGRPSKEYALTLDMAKELAMVERNEKGKQARQYFIECEKRAKDPHFALNDVGLLRGLLLQNVERVIELQEQVAELKPAQERLERIAMAEGTMCITNAAKTLQVRPKQLFDFLSSRRWIYRRSGSGHWTGYQDKIQSGYLEHKVTEVSKSDGSSKITEQVLVTPKGLVKLAELQEQPLH